jgi:hypothetical protein
MPSIVLSNNTIVQKLTDVGKPIASDPCITNASSVMLGLVFMDFFYIEAKTMIR